MNTATQKVWDTEPASHKNNISATHEAPSVFGKNAWIH